MDVADIKDILSNAVPTVLPVIREDLLHNFDREGMVADRGWPQLAASTVRRRGSAHPILRVTGRLRNAVAQTQGEWTGSGVRLYLSGDRADVGARHQSGTKRMPARPPVALSQEATDNAADAFSEALEAELNARGYEATARKE